MSVQSSPHNSDDDADTIVGAPSTQPNPADESPQVGTHVGRYVVIERAGAGAMGQVFRAYDPKLGREVAIKRVQVGAHSAPDVQARMLREAKAMAQLAHPNVVPVYDVDGDGTGLFLAMEYVEGSNLRQWLRSEDRPWTEVVSAFVEAGRGLAAAHAAGLVHRDFKPANVMVGRDGRIRVMDFGLARATDELGQAPSRAPIGTIDLTASVSESLSADLTHVGTVVGTPLYMAPEQHVGGTVDARSDQYAFCVALWQALYGVVPFAGTGQALLDAKLQGPPDPPTGHGVPRRIHAAIARGLEVTATERWPGMDELLDALAFDPGRRRRRRVRMVAALVLVAGAAAAVTALSTGASVCDGAREHLAGVWDDDRSAAARDAILGTSVAYAEPTWMRTEPVLSRYADAWVAMHTDACEATSVRREQSTEVLDLRMACLQRARASLDATVDVLATADAQVVREAAKLVSSLPRLEGCADVAALRSGQPAPDPTVAADVDDARANIEHANARLEVGRYKEALADLESLRDAVAATDYLPLQVEYDLRLSDALDAVGRKDEAIALAEDVLARALEHDMPKLAATAIMRLLRTAAEAKGSVKELEWLRRIALPVARRAGADDLVEAGMHNALAIVAHVAGDYDASAAHYQTAIAIVDRKVGPDSLMAVAYLSNLSNVHRERGDLQRAEEAIRHVLQVTKAAKGPRHPDVSETLNNLGVVLNRRGRFEEAESTIREAIEILGETHGETSVIVAMAKGNLARALEQQGKDAEAETTYRKALEIFETAQGPDHPHVAVVCSNLASLLKSDGRYDEAAELYARALKILVSVVGDEHPDVGAMHNNIGHLAQQRGDYDTAISHYDRAMEIYDEALGDGNLETARTLHNRGEVARAQAKLEQALDFFERAFAIRARDDCPPLDYAETALAIAEVSETLGRDLTRPTELATTAQEKLATAEGGDDLRAAIARWLAAR